MLVWLLAFLLLVIGIAYVVYRTNFSADKAQIKKRNEQRYTFKI